MNKDEIIQLAEKFLLSKNISFTYPVKMGRCIQEKQEIIFTDPLTLDPDIAVVDPEDIRVLVNKSTKEVTLVEQM